MTHAPQHATLILGEEMISPLHPLYDGLRVDGPARPAYLATDHPVWIVTRYDDVRTVLASPHVARDATAAAELFTTVTGVHRPVIGGTLIGHMLNADPPDHTRLRSLVTRAFTTRRVEHLRPRVEQIADRLLDAIADQDQVDLMSSYCFPLPLAVIGDMLGIPADGQERFRGWAQQQATPLSPDAAEAVAAEITAYLEELIAAKQAHPADDLLTALIQARDDGDRLSGSELVAMTYLMIMAGFETTMNLIGNGVLTLLRHPDQLAAIQADPGLLPKAIEAYLRYDGPVLMSMLRFTTAPVQVGEVTIPEGAFLLASLAHANRDPQRFAPQEAYDVRGPSDGHLGFGHGIHYCIGAPLARVEGQIAIGRLLRRFPRLSLAAPVESLRWLDTTFLRALISLPVSTKGA
ncbi:cytochrome P450 family protein [Solwaraspora sp. WMMA2101]|uniref:cytochrome P450 family protein n=1 Tax=Solwaraspora sp. WMMA2101 TaxID=3404124 RepID=UPI003B9593F4